jgi:hypothetical protein
MAYVLTENKKLFDFMTLETTVKSIIMNKRQKITHSLNSAFYESGAEINQTFRLCMPHKNNAIIKFTAHEIVCWWHRILWSFQCCGETLDSVQSVFSAVSSYANETFSKCTSQP